MTARTFAARARVQHKLHPELTPTEIAARIGSTRQAVEAALAVTHERRGRPGTASSTVRLRTKLLARCGHAARRDGVNMRQWIEAVLARELDRVECIVALGETGFTFVRRAVTEGVTDRGTAKRKRRRMADGKAE